MEDRAEPLVLGKLINRFVQGPLVDEGPRLGDGLVAWRVGSSLPRPRLEASSPETSSDPGVFRPGGSWGRAGSRNVKISAVST